MNMMTAKTQIEDLVSKRNAIIEKTANIIAEALIDRAKTKGLNGSNKNNTVTDIANLIRPFSSEEREEILTKTVIIIAANGKFGKTQNNSNDDDYDDLFSNRRSNMFGNKF
jgi:hypothetical protein